MSERPHLFITGISSGIGAALLRSALAAGYAVSGVARRSDRLQELRASLGDDAAWCHLQVADVSADDGELAAAVSAAVARFGPLRGVVANAGRGVDGELLQLSPQDVASVYACNVVGVHRTLQAVQPHCQPTARFVAVSSVAAFLPIPRMGAYCATKHALEAWAAAARMELRASGVRVMTCCPGTVQTEFFTSAPKPGQVWNWRPGSALSPERVARCILTQIRRGGPRRSVLPWFARLAAALYRLSPGLGEWIMGRALARMRRDEGSAP